MDTVEITDRVEVIEDSNSLIIKVRSGKNWLAIIFICFWQCGWLVGYILALMAFILELIGEMSTFKSIFLFVWLLGWSIGGIFSFLHLIWMSFGIQKLIISNTNSVKYNCHALGFNIKRQAFFENIKSIYIKSGHFGHFQKDWDFDNKGYLILSLDLASKVIIDEDGTDDAKGLEKIVNTYIKKNTIP